MDIEQARAALGIAAGDALFDEQIDAAYHCEFELRHPLKYSEKERGPAVEWARHLAEARAELHAEAARQRQRAAMIGWAPPGGPPPSGPLAPGASLSGQRPAGAPLYGPLAPGASLSGQRPAGAPLYGPLAPGASPSGPRPAGRPLYGPLAPGASLSGPRPAGAPLSGPPAPGALPSGPPATIPAAAPGALPSGPPATIPAAAPAAEPVPRRRMGPGAIVATVAGAVLATALLAAPVVAGGVSLGRHLADASHSIDAATKAMSKADGAAGTLPDSADADAVSHYTSGETGFTFPANLDYYNDGRNTERCSSDLVDGCWSAAVFPEQDCALLEVTYAFSNDETSVTPDDTRTTEQAEAPAFEPVILVWGSNDYDYSWIGDVQCVDPSDGDLSTTAEGSTAPA